MSRWRGIPFFSRPSWRVQLRSSVLDGVFMAALIKAGFLAAKDLGAPREWVVTWFAVTAFPMVLTPVFRDALSRVSRRRLFWVAGLAGRASFVALAFVDHWVPFLLLGMLPWFVMAMVLPAYHAYWQANYPAAVRGRLWGRAELLRGFVMVACYWGFGLLLEFEPELRRVVFPVAGLCGCVALAMLGHIRLRRRPHTPAAPAAARRATDRGVFRSLALLRQHRAFLWYEIGFMLYGFGFMLCNFLRDYHFAKAIDMSHVEFATWLALFQLTMPLMSPIYGVLFDRARAAWTSAVACALLVPYALILAEAHQVEVLWLAAGFFGAGMAGIHVCWNLGSVEFAGQRDVGPFSAVHAACVGLRAALMLPVALLFVSYAGNARPVFTLGAVCFGAAILVHGWLGWAQRRDSRHAAGAATGGRTSGRHPVIGGAGA